MTPPGGLRDDALGFLKLASVSDAVVVGPDAGGGAHGPGRGVTAAVMSELAEAGISARRVAGGDRFGTSVAAAGEVAAGVMPELGRTAIVASADVFADALVAGPFAARGVHPVLLSTPDELPASVAAYLVAADIEHAVLMVGTAALSAHVESAIEGIGVEVTRLAGKTRYDTAVKAAELVTDRYSTAAGYTCFASSPVGVARARVPFDSFSAAPLLSRLCAPLLLADPEQIPDDTAAFLDAARESGATVDLWVFGGDAAVSQAAIDAHLDGEDDESDGAEPRLAPTGDVDDCKPRGRTDTTAGFPPPDWAEPSTGTVRVAVLFMDFPDAQATRSPEAESENGFAVMEDYLETVSYGKLDVELLPHYRWLRADRPASDHVEASAYGSGLNERAGAHAVSLADPEVDFSNVNSVMVVFPGEHFATWGNAGGYATADGNTMNFFRVNTRRLRPDFRQRPAWVQRAISEWGILAAHELAHNLGLLDLYPYDRRAHARPAAPSDQEWIPVKFGLMDLRGYFLADTSAMVRRISIS